MIIFPLGYQTATAFWLAFPFGWALMQNTWSPDNSTEEDMADIVAHEATATEYTRLAVGSKSLSVFPPDAPGGQGRISFGSSSPNFGSLSGGEIINWLVLYHNDGGVDADSRIVFAAPCLYLASGLYEAYFSLSSQGTLLISTTC